MAFSADRATGTLSARLGPRSRPIDLVHLSHQCLGDAALEREILGLFEATIARCQARIEAAAGRGELAAHLHALKGAAGGVGAWSVMELARAAERELVAQGRLDPERIADLGLAVAELSAFIAEALAAPD